MTDKLIEEENPLILIAEDDAENIKLLCNILRNKEEYRVSVALDGRQALDLARNVEPDLILLDVIMPEMNGFEVCKELKRSPATRDIPIIFMSGEVKEKDIIEGLQAGAVDYVKKPYSTTELVTRVRTHAQLKKSKDRIMEMNRKLDQSRKALDKELSEAAAYVVSMLPPELSGNPSCQWRFIPSGKLGGDIFGYHWIDSDHFALYSLDVSGQGVGAALFSVTMLNRISHQSLQDTDFCNPAQVLNRFNEVGILGLPSVLTQGKSVAMWYGVYSPSIHKLVFAAAGHPPGLLLTGPGIDNLRSKRLDTSDPAIGYTPDYNYQNHQVRMDALARLFIFSDGACKLCGKCEGSMQSDTNWCPILEEIGRSPLVDLDQAVQFRESYKLKGDTIESPIEDDFALLAVQFQSI